MFIYCILCVITNFYFNFVIGELCKVFKKSSLRTNSKITFKKPKRMRLVGRHKVKTLASY